MANILSIINPVLFIAFYAQLSSESPDLDEPVLMVLSYDGFRNDYFDWGVTPYMTAQRKSNTYTKYVRNVFPTKTFPNHHSIATGLYPDEHGVVAHYLYDRKLNRSLTYSYELFHYDETIEPIWVLNEKRPNKYSGCMMWPGSHFAYSNIDCSHTLIYNQTMNAYSRIDTAISWILDQEKPANLVMIYIEEPDKQSHALGVHTDEILQVLPKIDKLTQYLDDKLEQNHLKHRTNIIHLSDHGMLNGEAKKNFNLTDFLKEYRYERGGSSPVTSLYVKNAEDIEPMYQKLRNHERQFTPYKYNELPERWRFKNKDRTGDITVVANPNFGFDEERLNKPKITSPEFGVHGYDNKWMAMSSMFYAIGPLIKKNNEVKPFDSVDYIYLFCEILKIEPPVRVKGNRDNILPILIDSFKSN